MQWSLLAISCVCVCVWCVQVCVVCVCVLRLCCVLCMYVLCVATSSASICTVRWNSSDGAQSRKQVAVLPGCLSPCLHTDRPHDPFLGLDLEQARCSAQASSWHDCPARRPSPPTKQIACFPTGSWPTPGGTSHGPRMARAALHRYPHPSSPNHYRGPTSRAHHPSEAHRSQGTSHPVVSPLCGPGQP